MFFIKNLINAKFTEHTLNGKEYLVVPVTMLREGVFSGTKGPLFYPAVENEKSTNLWNGMPIVSGHPRTKSGHVSARHPEVLNTSQVGIVLNSNTTKTGDLTAEAWIDIFAVNRVDPRILQTIYSGEAISVSTGILKAKLTETDGVHNGQSYTLSVSDMQPDHLAILMDEPAACDIDQGCGILVNRNNHSGEIETALTGLIRGLENNEEIRVSSNDIDDKHFAYELGSKLYRISYSINNNRVKLTGDPVEVVREVKFKSIQNGRRLKMKKDDLVDTIINSGCECWSEEDEDVLSGFTVNKLKKIYKGINDSENHVALANSLSKGFEDDNVKIAIVDGEFAVDVKNQNPKKKEGEQEVDNVSTEIKLEDLPQEVKTKLESYEKIMNERKSSLVDVLMEGVDEKQQEAVSTIYNEMSIEQLELLKVARPTDSSNSDQVSYKGRSTRAKINNSGGPSFDESDLLEVPMISWND